MSFYHMLHKLFVRRFAIGLSSMFLLALLTGCVADQPVQSAVVSDAGSVEEKVSPARPTESELREIRRQNEERLRMAQLAAEEREEERAEAARQAEELASLERAAALEIALRETERLRQQEVAEAQTKRIIAEETEITRLEAQIEVNNNVAGLIETANRATEDAITAAAGLSVALSAESGKYADTDTDGFTTQELNKRRLAELEQEYETLRERSAQLNRESQ